MTDNNIPAALVLITDATEVAVGETIYLTRDSAQRPCDPVAVTVLRHSRSGAKAFVPCPGVSGSVMGLGDYGLAYRGAMRVA